MKKLGKKSFNTNSIEAYACTCGSRCYGYCYCICQLLFGDKNGTYSGESSSQYTEDSVGEATAHNYSK